MKIYPSNHKIKKVDSINRVKDIPLAYVGSPENNKINVQFRTGKDYSKDYLMELKPYQVLDDFNTIIFDDMDNIVDNNSILHRNKDNQYYFIPKYKKIGESVRFNYKVLNKKNGSFDPIVKHNIKVGVIDNTLNATVSKKLISIFGKSNLQGLSHTNVLVNNGDSSPGSLINRNVEENDMMFIETDDGINYRGTDIKIDYDFYEDNNINIWLIAGPSFKNRYGEIQVATESESVINTNLGFYEERYKSDFIIETVGNIPEITGDKSLVVLENNLKNYVVISGYDFFNRIYENGKAIHEILLYVYSNRYITDEPKQSWVYDYVPDYEFKNGRLKKINSFTESYYEKSDRYLVDVLVDNKNITAEYEDNIITFDYKNKPNYKQHRNDTICSHLGEIIEVDNTKKYYIKSISPKVKKYSYKNDELEITFSGIVNSLKGINAPSDYVYKMSLDISKIRRIKLLYNVKNDVIEIVEGQSDNFVGVIVVDIYNDSELEVFDLRVLGGGTSDSEKDYDLLDIGNSKGRPLRLGGSMIIELPGRFEKYDDKIRESINKHKVADRHYIIIYDERR